MSYLLTGAPDVGHISAPGVVPDRLSAGLLVTHPKICALISGPLGAAARTVKTASGRRPTDRVVNSAWLRPIEHPGSAYDDGEVEALWAAPRQES